MSINARLIITLKNQTWHNRTFDWNVFISGINEKKYSILNKISIVNNVQGDLVLKQFQHSALL